jgi:hypothetical protein
VAVFPVEELDGADIFISPVNSLDLAVASQIAGDLRRGNA